MNSCFHLISKQHRMILFESIRRKCVICLLDGKEYNFDQREFLLFPYMSCASYNIAITVFIFVGFNSEKTFTKVII